MNTRFTRCSRLRLSVLGLLIAALAALGSRGARAQTYPPPVGCGNETVEAGWNFLGGPTGTLLTGAQAIYGLTPGTASFANLPVTAFLFGGQGVWAYFSASTSLTLPCVNAQPESASYGEPAGYSSVGNPYETPAVLTGSGGGTEWAITFDAATNTWSSWVEIDNGGSLALAPGEAAFVYTTDGGTVTFTST
jgi:hypothetical protein